VPAQRSLLELRRLRLRVEANKLQCLGEGEIAGLAGGELGVKDPPAFNGSLKPCSR